MSDRIKDALISLCSAWVELDMDAIFTKEGWCVNSSRIGVDVLTRKGFLAQAAVWDLEVGNQLASEMYVRGTPTEEWPDEAWNIGTFQAIDDSGPGMVRGHVVVEMGGYVVDLSAGQYNRPNRGIHIDGPMLSTPDNRVVLNLSLIHI